MKNAKLLVILIVTLIGFQSCFLDRDDTSNLANDINAEDLIPKDSELYNLIVRVTNFEDNPLQDIVCIRFSYSFLIFTYNEDLEIVNETTVTSDTQFSHLLENLPENHSISLSYPIETTLSDGTPFSITTNEELSIVIKACAHDAILAYANELFFTQQCVWNVPFIDGAENSYASGMFSVNSNSSMSFDFQNEIYTGTWIFFFTDDVLNFNINLAGDSQVAQDWNINFNVDYGENILVLTSNTNNYYLKRTCEFLDEIVVGQETPTEGIVAFDKGFYLKGWRYLEADINDLASEEWGCLSGDIFYAGFEDLGDGFMSSAAIANYHLSLEDYQNNPAICNPDNNGTVIALTALILGQDIYGNYPDWFLPSIEELLKLYENLHLQGLGNFQNGIYWSSTQASESNAKALDFSTGEILEIPKNTIGIRTRAIRYF